MKTLCIMLAAKLFMAKVPWIFQVRKHKLSKLHASLKSEAFHSASKRTCVDVNIRVVGEIVTSEEEEWHVDGGRERGKRGRGQSKSCVCL